MCQNHDFGATGKDTPKIPDLDTPAPLTTTSTIENCWMRRILLAFGWANLGLGIVGVFIPGLPTTVFLLIALWAFSKSSLRLHTWLWNHQRFGSLVRNWHEHQVIPSKVKVLGIMMIFGSFAYVSGFVVEDRIPPFIMAVILLPVVTYILTRTSAPSDQSVVANIDTDVD